MKTKIVKTIAADFIQSIWNNKQFEKLSEFLHPEFKDHSLPLQLPSNSEGLLAWIKTTSTSFEHRTEIEEQVTEGNKTVLKIIMHLKHIGTWRNIEPTFLTISVAGYRNFTFAENKIIGHWALIDGNSIENQLRQTTKGCKVQN